MHVLFLTQIIPFPPDAGPRVKTWHVLRYLAARGHKITLASFIRPEEEAYLPMVQKICCGGVHTIPIHRSRVADVGYWIKSQLTGRPFLIERDDRVAMRDLVQQLVEKNSFDFIHADQLGMAQFAYPYRSSKLTKDNGNSTHSDRAQLAPRLVFDAHNAVWTVLERMRENVAWYLRLPAVLEARRVKRFEGRMVRDFGDTLAVIEPDREALLEAVASAGGDPRRSSDNIHVIPIAVDTRALQPAKRQPASRKIVTIGTLHYPPNADGIRWFLQEIFPAIQAQIAGVKLTIIGKNPPPDFIRCAEVHPQSIQVTGYVPRLEPYMDQSALMIVPVRAGGGMRVRILEAFARGMPVVTTTVGLEGINARPGEDVLVADTPTDFAREVVSLLENRDLQSRLAANGRRLAETCYDWQVVLKKMDEVYRATDIPQCDKR